MNVAMTLASLRPMTTADLDAVVALEVLAYDHPWSRGNFADSLTAAYLCEVLSDDQGAICAYFVAMPGVDELHLLNITVRPSAQGLGLGKALMRLVQSRCEQLGLALLWLEVRPSNHRARALYKRLGFAEVGLRKGYYPAHLKREDAVVMRWAVGSTAATPPAASQSTHSGASP